MCQHLCNAVFSRADELGDACGVQDSKVLSETVADPSIPYCGSSQTNQKKDSVDPEQITDTKEVCYMTPSSEKKQGLRRSVSFSGKSLCYKY